MLVFVVFLTLLGFRFCVSFSMYPGTYSRWYCHISFIAFLVHWLLSVTLSPINDLIFFSSTLLACIIIFIFISCLISMSPVSFRSIVFGVPCERSIIILVSHALSFDNILLSFLGSHGITMTVASIHCLMPLILIPWNSLYSVSANISEQLLLFWSLFFLRCSSTFPFKLYTFPIYLYFGTFSGTKLLGVILLFRPDPIFTIMHFAVLNTMWHSSAT